MTLLENLQKILQQSKNWLSENTTGSELLIKIIDEFSTVLQNLTGTSAMNTVNQAETRATQVQHTPQTPQSAVTQPQPQQQTPSPSAPTPTNTIPNPTVAATPQLTPAQMQRKQAIERRRAQEAALDRRPSPMSATAEAIATPTPEPTPAQVDISHVAPPPYAATVGKPTPQTINRKVEPVFGQPVHDVSQLAHGANYVAQSPQPYTAAPVPITQPNQQPYSAKPAPTAPDAKKEPDKKPGMAAVAAAGVVAVAEATSTYKSPTPFDSMRSGPRPPGFPRN